MHLKNINPIYAYGQYGHAWVILRLMAQVINFLKEMYISDTENSRMLKCSHVQMALINLFRTRAFGAMAT